MVSNQKSLKEREELSATSSNKGRGLQKMVSSKKTKTAGGSGPATPPRQNRRQAASEVSREHNIYMMTKVDIMPGVEAPMELRTGYHKLLSTHKECNKTYVLLPESILTTDSTIVEPDKIPTRMSALMRHFMETLKIKVKCVLCEQQPGWVLTEILR